MASRWRTMHMDRRALEWERVLERRLGAREGGSGRRRRGRTGTRGNSRKGAQTRRRHRRMLVSGGHGRSEGWLQSTLRADGAGGPRSSPNARLSRGLHFVANSVALGIASPTSTYKHRSGATLERPTTQNCKLTHFAIPPPVFTASQDSVKVRCLRPCHTGPPAL